MFKDKIIKVNTDIPTNINREVMGVLANHQCYRAFDKAEDRLGNLEKGISLGWSINTIRNGVQELDSILNFYGNFIFQLILGKTKIKGELNRLFWNMYFPSDVTEIHYDHDQDGYYSILYNPHTTDGGIEIEGKFYQDKESEAKIFKSTKVHRGIGPTNDIVRFNLNIIFKINE